MEKEEYAYPSLAKVWVPPRGRYRTYFLADALFQVEARYRIKAVMGHGAYGMVCCARDHATGDFVAIKKMNDIFLHRGLAKRTLRELKMMRMLRHQNLLASIRVMRPPHMRFNDLYVVSELMETDLGAVIRSSQPLSNAHCQFFIFQVLLGLRAIHRAGVIHRDLKPRNLLVNSNCDLKICDFGLARYDDPEFNRHYQMSTYVATRWYRAPEIIIANQAYSQAVDMWSVGCILGELMGRVPLFQGRDSMHQLQLILSTLGTPSLATVERMRVHNVHPAVVEQERREQAHPAPFQLPSRSRKEALVKGKDGKNYVNFDFVALLKPIPALNLMELFPGADPLAVDLLSKMLRFDPAERITAEQALAHPYVAELMVNSDRSERGQRLEAKEFAFDAQDPTKEDLRGLVAEEVFAHNAEDTYQVTAQQDGVVLATLRSLYLQNNANQHVPSSSKRRRRRKSI